MTPEPIDRDSRDSRRHDASERRGPAQVRPAQARPVEARPVGTRPAEAKPAQHRRASTRQVAAVEEACRLLDDPESERLTLAELAERVALSPWHLQRLFKKLLGVSPREYAEARRSARFRAELREHGRVAEATYGAGYGSSSRVYEDCARRLGMTPATYAKGGNGARIVYAVTPSPLGRLLVAATAKGLCFLALGEDERRLVAELKAEFPSAASIEHDELSIKPSVEAVLAFIAGETPHLDLPLDVRATAFQRRVWNELVAIPYGETMTYAELAERLGLPKGQRAVARACATNPVSLVIPCHRVLRDDGALGGFRWGIDRKAGMLTTEAKGTKA
ncbi:methylated-DNA--[protein]-cysteine S-methyltransferase [Tistlia consotensis]|uniref:methylated-DNA--[protein]-cysteine S-methyltransferase n=1 Tax=Tistlia consotensis TaxID=1321365 RepID=UPI000A1699E6|nr:methylated-DNA--[protein]-cysteine S-methyltransferase [Tistlia consotensis]